MPCAFHGQRPLCTGSLCGRGLVLRTDICQDIARAFPAQCHRCNPCNEQKAHTALYNTTYITADTVVALLERIAKEYKGRPIHIFLDNARYQHCPLVKDTAVRLGIALEFLPPYSPNLNLIERLWKFVKAEVLAATYFQDAKTFQNAIVHFLNQLHKKKMKNELLTRLSSNFQLFDNAQNLTA